MLTLRLNRALLALAALIFAVSLIVNVITYGGLPMLPYIQWFSGAAGLIIMGTLVVLGMLSMSQANSIKWQLPNTKGLRWITFLVVLLGVYALYNALFAWLPSTSSDPLPGHLNSLRSLSITYGLFALIAASYLYRLIEWQRNNPNGAPTPQTENHTP